jgi:hypothetical protein
VICHRSACQGFRPYLMGDFDVDRPFSYMPSELSLAAFRPVRCVWQRTKGLLSLPFASLSGLPPTRAHLFLMPGEA